MFLWIHWHRAHTDLWVHPVPHPVEHFSRGDIRGRFVLPGHVTMDTVYIRKSYIPMGHGDVYICLNRSFRGTFTEDHSVIEFSIVLEDSLQARLVADIIKKDPRAVELQMTQEARAFLMK